MSNVYRNEFQKERLINPWYSNYLLYSEHSIRYQVFIFNNKCFGSFLIFKQRALNLVWYSLQSVLIPVWHSLQHLPNSLLAYMQSVFFMIMFSATSVDSWVICLVLWNVFCFGFPILSNVLWILFEIPCKVFWFLFYILCKVLPFLFYILCKVSDFMFYVIWNVFWFLFYLRSTMQGVLISV